MQLTHHLNLQDYLSKDRCDHYDSQAMIAKMSSATVAFCDLQVHLGSDAARVLDEVLQSDDNIHKFTIDIGSTRKVTRGRWRMS